MELVDREDLDSDPGSYQSISRDFSILMRMNYQLYDSSTNIMVLMSGFLRSNSSESDKFCSASGYPLRIRIPDCVGLLLG